MLPRPLRLWLFRALFVALCLAFSLRFYADLLPDKGGAVFCARSLGCDPQSYGASFRKQWLLNSGTFWWKAFIFRYDMSPADYARLRAVWLKEGWRFRSDGDGVIGTLVAQHYPVDCLEDKLEVGGSPRLNKYYSITTYSYTDECLYVELHYGS